jgi:hypothetical protein
MASTVVEQFVARLGWEVPPESQRDVEKFDDSIDDIIGGLGKLAVAAGAALAAIVGLSGVTNKHTAIQTNMANALGISADALAALGNVVENIGFDYEKVGDLVEELNNKMGEFELTGMTSVKEALQLVNLEFKELKDLSPEDQFIRIMDAAKDLEDQQVAVSAVDMLMGGDANKILGYLRTQEQSLAEIIQRQLELNFLTDQGREGAVAFTAAWGELSNSVGSIWAQFSGLLGEALTPLIGGFSDLLISNKEVIQTKLREWAQGIADAVAWLTPKIRWIIEKLGDLKDIVDKVVRSLGGWRNVLKVLGIFMASLGLVKMIATLQRLVTMWNTVGKAALFAQAKMLLIPAIIALIALILEDIWVFLEGGESLTGKFLTKLGELIGIDLVTPLREGWPAFKALLGQWWDGIKAVITALSESVAAVVLFIIEIFEKGLGPAWDNLVKGMGEIWGEFGTLLKDFWREFVTFVEWTLDDWKNWFVSFWTDIKNWFKDTFIAPVVDYFTVLVAEAKKKIQEIKGFLSGIPLLGKLFEDSNITVDKKYTVGAGIQAPREVRNFPGTTQTTSTTSNKVDVGGITVMAQPGQSPAQVGRSVRQALEEQVAVAVRANTKGIER